MTPAITAASHVPSESVAPYGLLSIDTEALETERLRYKPSPQTALCLSRRRALGKSEVADARAPIEAGRRRVVLVRVIEGAIVHRIDGEIAVIAPATRGSALATRAVEKMLLA